MTGDPDNLFIGGVKFRKVDKFSYLRLVLEIDGSSDLKIRTRIGSDRKAIGILNSVLWRRNISLTARK